MIKYTLRCAYEHEFEAWFSNSSAYDTQHEKGLIDCPHCGTKKVGKAIMAPSVKTSKAVEDHVNQTAILAKAQHALREAVKRHCDYVGKDFAQEARKIHYHEIPERPIYGEASVSEVADLRSEGIQVMAIPGADPVAPGPLSDKGPEKKRLS